MEGRESRIKTRETVRDIKTLDRTAVIAESLKREAVQTKDLMGNLIDDGRVTPEEYAEDRLRQAAEGTASGVWRQTQKGVAAARKRIGRSARLRNDSYSRERGLGYGRADGRYSKTQRETASEMTDELRRQYGVRQHEARMLSIQRRE